MKLSINDKFVSFLNNTDTFKDHKIFFDKKSLNQGFNSVSISFVSSYVRDCQGIHYFKDKEDGEEYLYSQHEAADAHKAFPCFDQPDMKAPYQLTVLVPSGWVALSTMYCEKGVSSDGSEQFSKSLKE